MKELMKKVREMGRQNPNHETEVTVLFSGPVSVTITVPGSPGGPASPFMP